MSATIGETFVLPLNNDNILLSLGSQSDNSNTGGILSIVNHLEIENFKVVVFPNPVKEFLSIKIWGLKNDTFIIEVSEISGKSLLHYSISNITDIFKINISSFVSGFYLLNIYSIKGEKIASTKFIKI
ncbi:MAG: T9SS type A sorting domain-containing protein [Bacteroidales bacterium]|jgi:hypothetical protein|nr:T9SS type A sorting domain-containing protein [Bacteroidales bacterium]